MLFAIDPTDFYFYMSHRLVGICIMLISAAVTGGILGRQNYRSGKAFPCDLSILQKLPLYMLSFSYAVGGVYYVSAVPAMSVMASLIYTLSGIVVFIGVATAFMVVIDGLCHVYGAIQKFRSRDSARRNHLTIVRRNEKGGREDIAG